MTLTLLAIVMAKKIEVMYITLLHVPLPKANAHAKANIVRFKRFALWTSSALCLQIFLQISEKQAELDFVRTNFFTNQRFVLVRTKDL